MLRFDLIIIEMNKKIRCFGETELYAKYHDEEWGVEVHDDRKLFEMLILEGAQAGLSWETVLKKREGYREAFYDFDVFRVSKMTDDELEKLRSFEGIIRNRLKIYSARKNALVFLDIVNEFGSFDKYIWDFVDGKQIVNHWPSFEAVPVNTETSDSISKDLKKRGMSFVGSTIMYAYMQAVGMVDDHLETCWKGSLKSRQS
jgi:DNA-3-methyladenine glycosylase I